jgi:hypothetical protein
LDGLNSKQLSKCVHIKWKTIVDEIYYLLKAIQDQGRFLPPLFKAKIKEIPAILTWKQKKKEENCYIRV